MDKKYVALTFDDGPNNVVTPLVLDALEKYSIPATFMLVGRNIKDDVKDVMQRQKALGCEFANHGFNHLHMTALSSDERKAEIEKTQNLVEKYTGCIPKVFRPPYIDVDEDLLKNTGLIPVCGLGCSDWDKNVDKDRTASEMIKNTRPGHIMLLHDSDYNAKTAYALDDIIPALKSKGYEFVTVSELFKLYNVTPVAGKMYTNVLEDN